MSHHGTCLHACPAGHFGQRGKDINRCMSTDVHIKSESNSFIHELPGLYSGTDLEGSAACEG